MFTSTLRGTRGLILAVAGTAALAIAPAGLGLASAHAASGSFKGRVTANGGLAERTAPSSHVGRTGRAHAKGSVITIDCAMNGTAVGGNHRWYRLRGKDAWVSARYVTNLGAVPYDCSAGDWSYHPSTALVVREGPSTADRKVGTLAKGHSFNTRLIADHGQVVRGNPNWLAVETPNGNSGWVSAAYVVAEDGR